MTAEPRMRDLYHEYLQGHITFEYLVEIANHRLARWEAEKASREIEAPESLSKEPRSPGRAGAAAEPRMRDLYQEYLEGRVSFEHLVETANRFLARWDADRRALEAQSAGSQATESET